MKIITLLSLYAVMICTIVLYGMDQSIPEKKIVIVIPSYNNKNWYSENLQSALSQNYSNFTIIYTDDCSPDGTGDLVEKYLELNDPDNKVMLIKNQTRRGALYNLYRMITMCDDDAIVVTLDGDDWLPDENVLNRLNEIYSLSDIWLTYGQFELHPSQTRGWASPMPDYIVESNAFRDFQHLPTHLRTFYAWLFKKIKLEDLLYQSDFYPMTWDQAMMFPMIEMAGHRHAFIPEIMYIYNDANAISDHYVSRQLQAYLAQLIRQKPRYGRLTEQPQKQKFAVENKADVIIFAQSPDSLAELLQSLDLAVEGVGNIFVMYKPTTINETVHYDAIQESYWQVEFCLIADHRANFMQALFALYKKAPHDYILFIKNKHIIEKPLSLAAMIQSLQKTSAYAFYLNVNHHDGKRIYPHMPLIELSDTITAWDFSFARDKWSCANSFDCVLHKKSSTLEAVLQCHYDLTPNGLEAVWANEGNLNRIGLCFNESKIANYTGA